MVEESTTIPWNVLLSCFPLLVATTQSEIGRGWTLYVAKDNGVVVGCVSVVGGCLVNLGVLPSYRGRGVGTQLVTHALNRHGQLYAWTDNGKKGFIDKFHGIIRTSAAVPLPSAEPIAAPC